MSVVSVVVLTMGVRPRELAAAVASARSQPGDVEVVLVVNGGDPDPSLADVIVSPESNLGIPEGRNAGASAAAGDLICFLDDDGELVADVFGPATAAFVADPHLGVIGLRVTDETGNSARRHLPGLRKNARRSSRATAFPGGACVIRRTAFEEVGGFCGPFRYGLEETDLAWRLIDAGWDVVFRSDLKIRHPRTDPTRHRDFYFYTARNRVWLARRVLPAPIGLAYVTNWTLVTIVRSVSSWPAIRAHLSGLRAGLRQRPGPRRPMRWRTVAELAGRGRPPVI